MDQQLVSLPADGRAAGLARAVVRERLRRWGLEDLLDVAVLLTSEVVANVVVHTASRPSLGLARDGKGVRVTVIDESSVPPRLRWHSATATTGRGIQLLQKLADDWGWDLLDRGKAVWFLLGGDRGQARSRQGRSPVGGARTGTSPPAPSPLGRYATSDGRAAEVWVELLGVPVRVLMAAREHHDGLMREFRLLAMSGAAGRHDVPVRLVELTRELGLRFASAGSRPDEDVERALERGLDTVDLAYLVPPAVIDGARRLEGLMREADEFCRSAQLMTLPRSPTTRRFAEWYIEQFVEQVAGHPASRWDGPLDPD